MSFAVQALSLEWMVRHAGMLEKKVYNVPEEIDDQIGRVKLAAMGLSIDTLTRSRRIIWRAGRPEPGPAASAGRLSCGRAASRHILSTVKRRAV